jgi:hypothetical protein
MTRWCKTFHLARSAVSDVVVRLTGEKLWRSEPLVNRSRETREIYSRNDWVSRKLFSRSLYKCYLLHLYLKSAGYTVFMAADGGEGLYQAKNDEPDLIITDINMSPCGLALLALRAGRARRAGLAGPPLDPSVKKTA